MKKMGLPAPSDGYASGRAAMPHVMALNKDKTIGMKNNNQPARGISNVTAYAKGGAVKKKMAMGGKACAKGGKVKKLAAGGVAKLRKKSPMPAPIKKVPYVNGG